VSPEDLSYRIARNAHSGTSFSPEERARQEQQAYYEDIKNVFNLFVDRITPDQQVLLLEEMTRYRKGNLSRRLDYLCGRSRIMSAMITGPSKFPTRRNEKHSRSYENKVQAFLDWKKKAIYRISKAFGLSGSAAISSDDKDAIEQLQAKIAALETKQARMKQINTLWKKGGSNPESLKDADLTDAERSEIINHMKYGDADRPYPTWFLTNNNGNIKRLKQRLQELQQRRTDATTETVIGSVTITDNVEDNRLQIFFPDRPSEEIRRCLKQNGFKWAPSIGAWQRMRNPAAVQRAKEIVNLCNEGGQAS
jgi:hypothetical protein